MNGLLGAQPRTACRPDILHACITLTFTLVGCLCSLRDPGQVFHSNMGSPTLTLPLQLFEPLGTSVGWLSQRSLGMQARGMEEVMQGSDLTTLRDLPNSKVLSSGTARFSLPAMVTARASAVDAPPLLSPGVTEHGPACGPRNLVSSQPTVCMPKCAECNNTARLMIASLCAAPAT